MLDTETGELTENIIHHEGNAVREFYAALEGPVVVGLEATGSMQWFLELLDELGIQYRVGHPAKIRAAEPRKQKHDRRDARLILELLTANRFPDIWIPSTEQRDLQTLLRDRHQWGKNASAIAAYVTVDGTQSRLAKRYFSVDGSGAGHAAEVVSATLHLSKTRSATELVR
jgi:transposase